jgi:pantoate--beta-alanine ligase
VKIIRTSSALRRFRTQCSGPVILVPTMGALHAGHAALIRRATALAGDSGQVVVSIFVNPTQFGPKEDLARYPRPFEADRALCEDLGVAAIFHPAAEEMYPENFSTHVDEAAVSSGLCGRARPGHFRGVCTVVLKFFLLVQPQAAVFGLKDFQQCRVIARMVRDLDVPVRLVFAPTVREPDGLALSSRNIYLSGDERMQAPALRRGLLSARKAFRSGENRTAILKEIVLHELNTAPLGRVDYLEVVEDSTLSPTPQASQGCTIALAVFFGTTRLIDNIQLA